MKNNNDFGKKISDKLNELDQMPNDLIWDNIESNLEKKKDRKLIYFSLPLLLAGIIIGYMLNNLSSHSKENSLTIDKELVPENDLKITSKKTVFFKKDSLIESNREIISSSKTTIKETENYIIVQECTIYRMVKATQKDEVQKTSTLTNLSYVEPKPNKKGETNKKSNPKSNTTFSNTEKEDAKTVDSSKSDFTPQNKKPFEVSTEKQVLETNPVLSVNKQNEKDSTIVVNKDDLKGKRKKKKSTPSNKKKKEY